MGPSDQNQKARTAANRAARWAKHQAKHPMDTTVRGVIPDYRPRPKNA